MSVLFYVVRLSLGALVPAVLALAGGPAGVDQPAAGNEARHEIDAFVEERRAELDVPGVAYAVFGQSGPPHTGTLGTDGDGRTVTTRTPFLWGSVAKPVTATLVMQLVEAGELDLDDPVVAHLPDFSVGHDTRSDRITVRHLLAHTSGVPTSWALTDQFAPAHQPSDVLDGLAALDLRAEPGKEHHYSSTNYLLLAAVIEAATGAPFPEVLEARVLGPAGMDTAVTNAAQAAAALPPGHRYAFGRPTAMRTPYDPAGASYGYLGGSLEDAVAFARASLTGDLLDGKGLRTMLRRATSPGDRSYGLGWRRSTLGSGDPIIWHGGAVAGYSAAIVWLPSVQQGVVVLQNAYGQFHDRALMETALGLADLLAGGEPDPVAKGSVGYSATLAVLLLGCALLTGLLVVSVRRIIRPSTARSPRRLILGLGSWLLALGALGYGLGVSMPAAVGVGLGQLVLWAPDVAWLVYALLAGVGLLVPLRLAVTLRTLSSTRGRAGRPAHLS